MNIKIPKPKTLLGLSRLPLWKQILVATEDIYNAYYDPKKEINMEEWGKYNTNNGVCVACFAGHCIIPRLGGNISRRQQWRHIVGNSVVGKLLNSIRNGNITEAVLRRHWDYRVVPTGGYYDLLKQSPYFGNHDMGSEWDVLEFVDYMIFVALILKEYNL